MPDRRKFLGNKGIVSNKIFLRKGKRICWLIFYNLLNNHRCSATRATAKGCAGYGGVLVILVIIGCKKGEQSLFAALFNVATRETGNVQKKETKYEAEKFH